MKTPRTETAVLVAALRILERDIESGDGVANAAIAEAAGRLEELERENAALKQRILDDSKAYGCELRDPSGTIWDHAQRVQEENAALRERLINVTSELSVTKVKGAAVSDTPRTDAFEALPERPINWWDFARQMERENAALRQALIAIAEQKTSDEIDAERTALITDYGTHDFEANYDRCIQIARAAIDADEGGGQ